MPDNTNPRLLSESRFSREQEERDREAAMRSLDDTTLRPALRYSDPDDTEARAYAAASRRQPAYAPSPAPARPRGRWKVGMAAICAIALALGALTAILYRETSPRSSSVGIFGVQQPEAAEPANEPQVTTVEETIGSTDGAPAVPEPEATIVAEPEVAEPEASQEPEADEPETYTITWTDEPRGGHGPREEHSLTYTYENGSYTIEYDGYSVTMTEEELEWLLGEGWDEGTTPEGAGPSRDFGGPGRW